MGFFSELDIEINDLISQGVTRDEILAKYPFLSEKELSRYFSQEYDYSIEDADVVSYDDLVNEPDDTWIEEHY
jgi:hypothetical protein